MSLMTPQPVDDKKQDSNNFNFYREIVNLEGHVVDVTTTGGVAGTEFSVSHGLGRVPTNVEVLTKQGQTDAYILVKPSGTAWTNKIVYLHCNTDNAALRLRIT